MEGKTGYAVAEEGNDLEPMDKIMLGLFFLAIAVVLLTIVKPVSNNNFVEVSACDVNLIDNGDNTFLPTLQKSTINQTMLDVTKEECDAFGGKFYWKKV